MTQRLRFTEYDFNGQFKAHRNVAAAALAGVLFIETLSIRICCMNVLAAISPGLKVLFERVGKPEIINRPDFLRFGETGAVIACNHVGWADRHAVRLRRYRIAPQAIKLWPKLRVLYATGNSITDKMKALFVEGAHFLPKPYTQHQLQTAVEELLAA